MIIAENVTLRLLLRWNLTSIPVCLFHDTLFFIFSNAIKSVVWRSNFFVFSCSKDIKFPICHPTLPLLSPHSFSSHLWCAGDFSDSAQSIVHNSYAGRFPDIDGYTCCRCTCCSKKEEKKQRRCTSRRCGCSNTDEWLRVRWFPEPRFFSFFHFFFFRLRNYPSSNGSVITDVLSCLFYCSVYRILFSL